MSIKIKYLENRKDWRKWLNDNFETANEVWFVFPSKSSGEKSITYNDAVEEALWRLLDRSGPDGAVWKKKGLTR